jgi:hypothetical protein
MNVAMMQPAFMPWQGFFELIYKSDRFVLLDDFQFSVQSYHQRNRLFVSKGQVGWYSVPVRKSVSFGVPLNRTMIEESDPWRKKMWKRFQQNYYGAAFYSEIAPRVEEWLFAPTGSLAEQNIAFIMLVCGLLGIRREFRRSSGFPSGTRRSARVLELLRWSEATRYYCARGSFPYMKSDGVFPVGDIEVLFQDFSPCAYQQIGSPSAFVPHLSILDSLMNVGPEKTTELVRNGTSGWSTWDEMALAEADSWAGTQGDPDGA